MTKYFLFPLLALASVLPGRAEIISLDAPSEAGGFFDVAVNLTDVFSSPHDGDYFLGYGFDVAFDNAVVSYLGETPGTLFTDWAGTAQVAGVATGVVLGPSDFAEPLTLAVLHFETIGRGPTTISIAGDISNFDQGLIYVSGADPISASTSLKAVPEPSVFWLLSLGLLMPLGRRWFGAVA